MNNLYSSLKVLKHFSGFKQESLQFRSENVTGMSVVVAYNSHNKETGFNCFLDNESYKSSMNESHSFEIINLLQEILMFRVIFKAIEAVYSQNPVKYIEANDNVDMLICIPPVQSLPPNAVLLFPTLHSRLALLYKSSSLPIEKDLYLRNVTGNMWVYLAGVLILLALCFRLSTHIHNSLTPRHSDWSWLEVIQWALGAICQQGSEKHPQGWSCRTMFVIGYLTTYLIYTGYAAGITSLLAVKTDTEQLHWHKAMKYQLPFVALCNSDGERYLQNTRADGHERVSNCVESIQELVATVKDTNSAAVMSEPSLMQYLSHHMSENDRCKVSISKQIHPSYYSGFVIKRNSVLKRPFNYWLLRLKEHGLLKRMLGKSLKPPPVCQMPAGYTEVGFEHVKSSFFIIIIDMVAAITIFCLEKLFYKNGIFLLNKRQNKKGIIIKELVL